MRAKPHDGALAEILLDLRQRSFEGLLLVHSVSLDDSEVRCLHRRHPMAAVAGRQLVNDMYPICSQLSRVNRVWISCARGKPTREVVTGAYSVIPPPPRG